MGINRILVAALLASLLAGAAFGQRPRSVNDPARTDNPATAAPVQQSVRAKYEGGIFGYNKKMEGTLTLDDADKRLLFRDKRQQEVLSIPYASIASAFADTKSKRPIAADVASRVSIFAMPALLIKKKFRYLTLQYNDPDTKISGVTSFKMENKETLASVLNALANKAGLTQRGEIFVRKAPLQESSSTQSYPQEPQVQQASYNGAVLNGQAVSLPRPTYPAEARDAGATGTVAVRVTIDEEGNVVSAQAISGHRLLHEAAEDAARQAKFGPTKSYGEPVKVSGVITYNFVL